MQYTSALHNKIQVCQFDEVLLLVGPLIHVIRLQDKKIKDGSICIFVTKVMTFSASFILSKDM